MGLDEIMITQDIDLVHGTETDWIGHRSEPKMEFEPEMEQMQN